MRKLAVALTAAAAILFAGTLAWKAEAETWRGAKDIANTAQNFTPIQQAACGGWGPHCRPGRQWVCGPYGRRCWCARCW
jgi:hypothetical protein